MKTFLLALVSRLYSPGFRREYGKEWWELARNTSVWGVFIDALHHAPGTWSTSAPGGKPNSVGGASLLGTVSQDTRYAFRILKRRPFFSFLAVGTLGLGIGSATAMFSVVEGVLLRPPPYQDPDELVAVWETFPSWQEHPQLSEGWDRVYLAWPEYERWRDHQTVFDGVALYGSTVKNLAGDGRPSRAYVGQASSTLLDVLGVQPLLGRGFLPGEDGPNGERVALLSHPTWVEEFGSDQGVVGRSLRLNDDSFTIVGVLPAGFHIRELGTFALPRSPDLWIPLGSGGARMTSGSHSWEAIARLRDGINPEQALTETETLLRGDRTPDELGARILDRSAEEDKGLRGPLLLLLAGSLTLLLIAIVNVAILMAGEVANRRHEMATRLAIGARIPRIVRQLLTESLIVGLAGSALGVFVADVGTDLLLASAPALPPAGKVGVNPIVLLFALGGGVVAALFFGMAPSVNLLHGPGHHILRTGHSVGRRGQLGFQRTLVTLQIALTVVLLSSGTLLGRSLGNLFAVETGFDVEDLSMVRVNMPRYLYSDADDQQNRMLQVRETLAALPGVQAVSGTNSLPFHGFPNLMSFGIEGRPEPENGSRHASHRTVLPGFFETMGIPILEGRPLSDTDRPGTPVAAVVSRSMAETYWPNESPLGSRILFGDTLTVVGVAADVLHESPSAVPLPTLYVSFLQEPSSAISFVVRTDGDAEPLLPAFHEAVWAVDDGIPAPTVATLSSLRRESTRDERFRTMLLLVFATSATLLSVAGVFGITARAVVRRSRELAVRKALGAEVPSLVRVAVGGTASAGLVGIAIGVAGTLAVGRLMTGFLFGVSSWDPITLGSVSVGFLVLCLAASFIPARRAGAVAPMEILREE
jgi:putative ABC transport system permease protein